MTFEGGGFVTAPKGHIVIPTNICKGQHDSVTT